MIVYFVDRTMNILGHAATNIRKGFVISDDLKTDDVETGVSTFECTIGFDKDNRLELENMVEVGNYLLRNNGEESECYTIVDLEIDTKAQEIWIYAEDAGLDLINEIAAEYTATSSQNIEYYINKWIVDSGFEIGINECPDSTTRKLSWDGESTVTERLASIATQFGNYEISYSFAVDGMRITNRYVNIHEKRGKDIGEPLRLNREIDRIITKKSITNLATALKCTGGTPENEDDPITLNGYEYDDGDFYVKNSTVYSRDAADKWGRFGWAEDINPSHDGRGYILRHYSYDTLDQKTLCNHAIAELKKYCDMEINYEVDIAVLPENAKIGDRVNIVDDAGELYLSTRILKLESSEVNNTYTATLGEHIIKQSGISSKVEELAAQFAEQARSAEKALQIAVEANNTAESALEQVEDAIASVEEANEAVQDAIESIDAAKQAAQDANAAAEAAQDIVDHVDERIDGLEVTIQNAQDAADNAQQAAETADKKAEEAKTAVANAQIDLEETQKQVTTAQQTADTAISKAESARLMADSAEGLAAQATWTADEAKADAAAAVKEVDELSNDLTTLSNTMTAEYARKTELTETEAALQTQINQNAAEISSTASKLLVVDETANNAAELAAQAQTEAQAAQKTADEATADAEKAQEAADAAQKAADDAQAEADTAKAAADTAQQAADDADAKVQAAQADLATVEGRVGATEEEIQAAQQAVIDAQTKADEAHELADTAEQKAITAQNKADTAYSDAAAAQTTADNAAKAAKTAQDTADKAVGDAATAQAKANEAANKATTAQSTADTAKANAATAQAKADQAYSDAQDAQDAADAADLKARTAASNLATAEANLAAVTSRVDATEEEIEAAQADVVKAKAAADAAQADADAAQSTANTAKANAATAQTAANNAKAAADAAQADADAAKDAADKAQADVDALAVRVTSAETKITQNSEQIALMAKKTEVATTLGGYYTKSETDSKLTVSANQVLSTVSGTYATIADFNNLTIGGRNLLPGTKEFNFTAIEGNSAVQSETYNGLTVRYLDMTSYGTASYKEFVQWTKIIDVEAGATYTFSFYAKGSGKIRCHFYGGRLRPIKSVSSQGLTGAAADGNVDITLSSEWQRYWVTYTVEATNTQTSTANKNVLLRLWGGNKAYVCGAMFEKASKASNWAPAPEDMATVTQLSTAIDQTDQKIALRAQEITDMGTRVTSLEVTANGFETRITTAQNTANTARTEAANAAKTATNFMSYDATNGLLIGNKSSGSWSGYRAQVLPTAFNILNASGTALASYGTTTTIGPTSAQHVLIDSDSVDIKNGTAVNSTFSADEISLAKNNASATIDMCGGAGKIYVKEIESNDFFNIESDNVSLTGTGYIQIESCPDTTGSPFAEIKANSFSGASERGAFVDILTESQKGSSYTYSGATFASTSVANPYIDIWVQESGTETSISIVPDTITLKATDTDVTGKLTATGEIFAESNIRVNSKTVNDTKEGVFIAKAGYMQIQRASSNPYIDFVYGTGASSCGRIGVNSSKYMEFTNASRYTFSSAPYVNSMKMAAVCSGYADPGAIAANTYVDKTITFPFTFESTPNVVACLFSSATSSTFGGFAISVVSRTKTGATIRIFNNTGTQRSPDIFWIATQN